MWRAVFTGEGPAAASLRRLHDLGQRAEEAERLARETVQADRARAIVVTAHGEVQELLPFAPRGEVLGYTCRTEAGFGWVTAYGSHAPYAETSREDAEQLVALALVEDRKDGRGGAEPAQALLVDCDHLNLGAARTAACRQHRRACLFEDTYDKGGARLGWTYTMPGRYFGRGDITCGWIVANGRTGQLVNSRNDARAALAQAWATDRAAPSV